MKRDIQPGHSISTRDRTCVFEHHRFWRGIRHWAVLALLGGMLVTPPTWATPHDATYQKETTLFKRPIGNDNLSLSVWQVYSLVMMSHWNAYPSLLSPVLDNLERPANNEQPSWEKPANLLERLRQQ